MLYLIATPIGIPSEISIRALDLLRQTETIIVESTKESSTLLKLHGILNRKYRVLNEHSTLQDVQDLVKLCAEEDVALLSDCGTPGFCDPGSDLVHHCRAQNIPVKSILGPSALMGLLSLSGQKLNQFLFRGFLPADNIERVQAWKDLQRESRAIVLMDTPYRLTKLMKEVAEYFPNRLCLLVTDLSQENEEIFEDLGAKLGTQVGKRKEKAEFMLLVYPHLNIKSNIQTLSSAPARSLRTPRKHR